jgi:hypothetical protein
MKPMSRREELNGIAKRAKAESLRLVEAQVSEPGSRMETEAIADWKAQNPTLYQIMKDQGALEALAHVVVERRLKQERELVKAGLNPSDARTEAYRDQMMLG